MSIVYDRSPLKVKLPEFNGGEITRNDAFPGMSYYNKKSDVIDVDAVYSCVYSPKFYIYNTVIAPKVVKYIPSLDVFSLVIYKGIYIYNPSIEKDDVRHETKREDVFMSINGGSTFNAYVPGDTTEEKNRSYYEGDIFSSDLNDATVRSGLDKTSANDNIVVELSTVNTKNNSLVYFEEDGSSRVGNISARQYTESNQGVSLPDLDPGDFVGIYLKISSEFSPDSKPVDYSFINLSYSNIDTTHFGAREAIPGATSLSGEGQTYFTQSIALKFNTNFSDLAGRVINKVDALYDRYPPFFYDYRESENIS